MASKDAMEAKAVWQTSVARLTAVAVSVREGHSIAFLGDARGNLHKVVDLPEYTPDGKHETTMTHQDYHWNAESESFRCCNRVSLRAHLMVRLYKLTALSAFMSFLTAKQKNRTSQKHQTSVSFFFFWSVAYFSTSSPPPYTAVWKIPIIPALAVFQHPQASIPQWSHAQWVCFELCRMWFLETWCIFFLTLWFKDVKTDYFNISSWSPSAAFALKKRRVTVFFIFMFARQDHDKRIVDQTAPWWSVSLSVREWDVGLDLTLEVSRSKQYYCTCKHLKHSAETGLLNYEKSNSTESRFKQQFWKCSCRFFFARS